MLKLKVIATGNFRNGIAKGSGNPYWMCEAFVELPGSPYPQKISYYAGSANEVLPAGEYECDVRIDTKDERLTIEMDPRQGRRLSTAPRETAPLKQA